MPVASFSVGPWLWMATLRSYSLSSFSTSGRESVSFTHPQKVVKPAARTLSSDFRMTVSSFGSSIMPVLVTAMPASLNC